MPATTSKKKIAVKKPAVKTSQKVFIATKKSSKKVSVKKKKTTAVVVKKSGKKIAPKKVVVKKITKKSVGKAVKKSPKKIKPIAVVAKKLKEKLVIEKPIVVKVKKEKKAATLPPPTTFNSPLTVISKKNSKKKKFIIEKPVEEKLVGAPVKKVFISQVKPLDEERSPYAEIAKKYKLDIEFQPFFEIHGVTAKEFRRYRIHLHEFTAVIFTSRNAIDHFFRLITELKSPMSSETKYFCTSESIAFYLQKFIQYRKRKVFYGDGTTKDMLAIMSKHIHGEKYLLPCSETANQEIVSHLKKENFNYFEAILYRTVPSEIKHLKLDNYDMMVFFSPSAIEALTKNFPNFKQKGIRIGAFGPTTSIAIKEAGFKIHAQAPRHGISSMAAAIEHYLRMIK